jgi:hypothetical protein
MRRQAPVWARRWFSALLIVGIVAMFNSMVADSQAAGTASHSMTLTPLSAHVPGTATSDVTETQASPAATSHVSSGWSMAECCGLLTLCIAMILGIGALALARSHRTSLGRVLWQLPPPHTFSLGRALAPSFSLSPLQRTAVLRL